MQSLLRGGVAHQIEARNQSVLSSNQSEALVVSLSKRFYPQCLVLVGSRNGLEHDLHKQNCLFHNHTEIG